MLVSLDKLKEHLGVTGTDFDDFLTGQCELVSEAVEMYCRRKFAKDSFVQTFHIEDFKECSTRSIPMAIFPVESVQTVKEISSSGESVVTDFRLHGPTGILVKNFSGEFFSNGDTLEVTYTAGYDPIPHLVKGVILSIVQERYNKKVNGIDLNFGSDVQRINIAGTVSIDFDYSLASNDRKSPFGNILGNHMNVLDYFRSEKAVLGSVRLEYVS